MPIYKVLWPNNTTPVHPIVGKGRRLYGGYLFNVAATPRYLRFFDTLAAPTMGATSPVLVLPIPGEAKVGAGGVVPFQLPLEFTAIFDNGLWISVTTGIADLDNTAPGASEVIVNLLLN
jgi:hypothetical protein